jgi:hypothetical protein
VKRTDMGISSSLAAAAIQTLSADGEYVRVCVYVGVCVCALMYAIQI